RVAPVQPHVERAAGLKAEAALGRVDVARGDAQVEHGAVHALPADLAERRAGVAKVRAPEDRPRAEARELLFRRGERLLVPVESQKRAVGFAPLEYFFAVSPSSKRSVKIFS